MSSSGATYSTSTLLSDVISISSPSVLKSFMLFISDFLATLTFTILHKLSSISICAFLFLLSNVVFAWIGVLVSPKYVCEVDLFPWSSSAYITYIPFWVDDVYFTFTLLLCSNSNSSPWVSKSIVSSYFSFLAIFILTIVILTCYLYF